MKVLAIDQSLNASGICVMEDQRPILLETINSGDLRGMDRLDRLIMRFTQLVDLHQPQIIVMEDYARSIHGSASLIPLVELGGLIKMHVHRAGYGFGLKSMVNNGKAFLVQNSTNMKKFVLGKGSLSKDPRYLLTVMEKIGTAFTDTDQADAYMHAVMASMINSVINKGTEISSLLQYQQEALLESRAKKIKGMSAAKALKLPEEDKRRILLAA